MSEKKELIIGMLIGDGSITKKGSFLITHSIKQQEYFYYKKEILESFGLCFSKIYTREKTEYLIQNITAKFNEVLRIYSNTTPLLKQLRKDFYPEGKKIIPDNIEITPKMWSYIYQDDGRQNKSNHYFSYPKGIKTRHDFEWVNRYTLYTDSFDLRSIENLQKSLLSYDIKSSINYSNKNKYPHIHICDKQSKTNFKNMIEPYMCEGMRYKLNLPTYINN
jgi:hypothetical protein